MEIFQPMKSRFTRLPTKTYRIVVCIYFVDEEIDTTDILDLSEVWKTPKEYVPPTT